MDQEARNVPKKDESDQTNDESEQTNDEFAQQHFGAEQLCELLGMPLDHVEAIFVEFVVRTKERPRAYYELAVCPYEKAERTTQSRLPPGQWVQLYFGSTEPDNQVVRCNGGFGLSPDQTAPFQGSLYMVPPIKRAPSDAWQPTARYWGSLLDLLYLIPNQPGTLSNSLLPPPNQEAIRNNEFVPAYNGSNERGRAEIDRTIDGTPFSENLTKNDPKQQKPDMPCSLILNWTAAIVIIAAVFLGAYLI